MPSAGGLPMTKPRKRAVRRLMIDALALAETFDHETAPHCHDLIEAMDRAEGDTDFEPSLGAPEITLVSDNFGLRPGPLYDALTLKTSQADWCRGASDDLEHDPVELGELTESGFANEMPWDCYTGILDGGLWNWRGERV